MDGKKKYRTDVVVRGGLNGEFVATCDALALRVTGATVDEVLGAAKRAIEADLVARDRRGERAHRSTTTMSSSGDAYSLEVEHPPEHFTEMPLSNVRVAAVVEGEVANAFPHHPEIRDTLKVTGLGGGRYSIRLGGEEATLETEPHETEASLRSALASSLATFRIKLLR